MQLKRRWELGSAVLLSLCLLIIGGAYGYRRYLDYALVQALDHGRWRTAVSLVRAGADPRCTGKDFGDSALDAAINEDEPIILQTVLKRAPELTPRSEVRTTPLIVAASIGSNECVRSLLDAGANIEERDLDQMTALMEAAGQNRVETIRLLLQHGAAVNARAAGGVTALMLAASAWHAEAVELLLKAGADPQCRNGTGQTALSLARTYHPDEHDLPTPEERRSQRRILALLQNGTRSGSIPLN